MRDSNLKFSIEQEFFDGITWSQYEDAIRKSGDVASSREMLLEMYNKADTHKRGYITKDQLIESIMDDIANGHEEVLLETNRENIRQTLLNSMVSEPREEIYGGHSQNEELIESAKKIKDPKEDPFLKMLQNHSLNNDKS